MTNRAPNWKPDNPDDAATLLSAALSPSLDQLTSGTVAYNSNDMKKGLDVEKLKEHMGLLIRL